MSLRQNNILFYTVISCCLFYLLLVTIPAGAEDGMTLQEAVEQGLAENNELQDLHNRIAALKRELALIEARQDWQLSAEASYDHTFTEDNNQLTGSLPGENENSAALNINKISGSGLNISPTVTVTEGDLTPELSLNISRKLYPTTPSELDKTYYKTSRELLKARGNYREQKASLILKWLESYLNLYRLTEKRKIYQKSLQQAEENMQKVRKKQEIGEAGRQELLTARLSIKEAEYLLLEADNKFEEALLAFRQNIGLSEDRELRVQQSQYITELRERIRNLAAGYGSKKDLMTTITANNYELKVSRIDIEVLKKELEWLEREGRMEINMTGGYYSSREELTAGIDISYQLYDGGQQKIQYNDKRAEVAARKEDYENLITDLEHRLQQYKNAVELADLKLEQEKLREERSIHKAEVARRQFEVGLIDYLEYQETLLASREASISVGSSKDSLFINRLQLIKFIDVNELMEEI